MVDMERLRVLMLLSLLGGSKYEFGTGLVSYVCLNFASKIDRWLKQRVSVF